MLPIGTCVTSAEWVVREGAEDAFVAAWTSLADASAESPGGLEFSLLRDRADSRHFVSFGRWRDHASLTMARSQARFLEPFRRCQALCERSRGSDFAAVASV